MLYNIDIQKGAAEMDWVTGIQNALNYMEKHMDYVCYTLSARMIFIKVLDIFSQYCYTKQSIE